MSMDKDFPLPRLTASQRHLMDKYTYYSASNAEVDIKSALTNAKRMRTQLAGTAKSFERVLPDDGLLALKAAAATVSRLVEDLEVLAPLAKRHAKFVAEKREREHQVKMQAAAAARWPNDSDLLQEVEDLLAFLAGQWRTDATAKEAETFIAARHRGATVCMPSLGYEARKALQELQELPAALEAADLKKARRLAIEIVEDTGLALLGHPSSNVHGDRYWHVGRDDYLLWREARRIARHDTSAALAAIAAKQSNTRA